MSLEVPKSLCRQPQIQVFQRVRFVRKWVPLPIDLLIGFVTFPCNQYNIAGGGAGYGKADCSCAVRFYE
jgi:hypothetical protein